MMRTQILVDRKGLRNKDFGVDLQSDLTFVYGIGYPIHDKINIFSLLINKYTKHKLTIIRCQSQRLIWRRSESYNVLLSYNENKINKYKIYREKANYYNI